jgi:TolB protein
MRNPIRLAFSLVLLALPAAGRAEPAAPLAVALPDFIAGNPADREIARDISRAIAADLKSSGSITPIYPSADTGKSVDFDRSPSFADWRGSAQALVTGRIALESDGRLRAEFRIWDVATGQPLSGQQYFTSPEQWRAVAHVIADEIHQRLTGKTSHFESNDGK